MASRREYELLFKLNAQLGNSYAGTFTKAQQQLISMQKEIDALSKTQSDITAYQKQQSAVDATQKKLEVLQQQYANIQKEISETGEYSSALANQMLAKQLQIDKTNDSLTTQGQKLAQMSAALREAGVDTNDLGKASANLTTQMDALKQKQEAAAEKATGFGSNAAQAFSAVQQAIVAAGIATALNEIATYFKECAEASMEFESAMTGVAKTTDFTDAEFSAMSKALKEMSTEIPATTTDLAAVAEAAGQLGIAKEDLLSFTETMTMLGTATNLSADEAASQLAKFANITKMSAKDYDELGSVIVALGNNFATTEADIVAMGRNLAAAGSLVGLSEANIMGISAAMSSLGIEAQMGGTAISKLMREFEIMIATGSADLESYAQVAGMSADAFRVAWGENAVSAIASFINGLGGIQDAGGSAIATLDELGITESRQIDAITRLASSGGLLVNAIDMANAAWEENTALTAESEKRYATTQSKLVMMQNAYNNLQVAIGNAYTPVLREAYSAGSDMLDGMAEFVERNPELIRAATAAAGALITTTAAVTGLSAAVKAFTALKAAGAFAAFTGPVWAGIAAVTVLAAGIAALASVTDEEAKEVRGLTEASRSQYDEIQRLNAEYQRGIELHGEETKELQSLRFEIDNLTAEYENSKESIADFSKQVRESISANKELIESHQASIDEIDREEYNAMKLVGRLAELASQTENTGEAQAEMHAIINSLNQALPELNLRYEDIAKSGGKIIDVITATVKAQAEQDRYTQAMADLSEAMKQQSGFQLDLIKMENELTAARERSTEAEAEYMDLMILMTKYDTSGGGAIAAAMSDEAKAAKAASENVKTLEGSFADLQNQMAQNTQQQSEYKEILEQYIGIAGEASEGNLELQIKIQGVTSEMEALAAAYTEAYNAALESVQGQYNLWDEAAEVVAMSAETINAGLESQAAYWRDYNDNLASLTGRESDIAGLSEMLASFADGSKESVNAISGMADALEKGDIDTIREMVDNWQALQEEQKAVSGSLADLEKNFSVEMAKIQSNFEETIKGMSLGSEAAESGKRTIEGFISAATDGETLAAVEAAYGRLARAANNALSLHVQYNASVGSTTAVDGSHAAGLDYVPYDGYIAELHKGERVLTSEEAQMVMFAPQFMAALSAMGASTNAVTAEASAITGGAINISLGGVAFNIDAEVAANSDSLRETLYQAYDDLAEFIYEKIDQREKDNVRRSYS